MAAFVEENKWQLADQTLYQKRFSELASELNQAKDEYSKFEASLQNRSARKHQIDQFIGTLSDQGILLKCFDEALWNVTIDEVLVKQSGKVVINLKTGQQIIKDSTISKLSADK